MSEHFVAADIRLGVLELGTMASNDFFVDFLKAKAFI
jgi:hypothetical protein